MVIPASFTFVPSESPWCRFVDLATKHCPAHQDKRNLPYGLDIEKCSTRVRGFHNKRDVAGPDVRFEPNLNRTLRTLFSTRTWATEEQWVRRDAGAKWCLERRLAGTARWRGNHEVRFRGRVGLDDRCIACATLVEILFNDAEKPTTVG